MPDMRYHVSLRGESRKSYSLAGGRWRSLDELAELLEDLTGFLAEYLKKEYLKKVKPGQAITLALGEIPIWPMKFVIRCETRPEGHAHA